MISNDSAGLQTTLRRPHWGWPKIMGEWRRQVCLYCVELASFEDDGRGLVWLVKPDGEAGARQPRQGTWNGFQNCLGRGLGTIYSADCAN